MPMKYLQDIDSSQLVSKRFNYFLYLLIFLVCIAGYQFSSKQAEDEVIEQETARLVSELRDARKLLTDKIDNARQRAKFVALTPPIQGLVRAQQNNGVDPVDHATTEQWRNRLHKIFSAMIQTDDSIDQLRVISVSEQGQEVVRVERDGNAISVVEKAFLQNKSQEIYYQDSLALSAGQVYVTEINLNREYGEVSLPLTPVFRVIIPVFDQKNQLAALVVENTSLKSTFNLIKSKFYSGSLHFFLLNEDMNFILHPDSEKDFSFQMDQPSRWADEYSEDFRNSPKGNLINLTGKNGYPNQKMVFTSISNFGVDLKSKFYLVAATPEAQFEQHILKTHIRYLTATLITLFVLIALFLLYQKSVMMRLRIAISLLGYQQIVQSSSDAIIAVNHEGVIRVWNRAAEKVFGESASTVIGLTIYDLQRLIPDLHFGKHYIIEALNGKPPAKFVTQLDCSGKGKTSSFEVNVSETRDAKQNLVSIALIFHDISEQVDVQKQLQSMNEALETQVQLRTKELEESKDQAISLSKTKSQFLANMSHEIRTPMNAIMGLLHILETTSLETLQRAYVFKIKKASSALLILVNDILDFSKIEAGKLDLDRTPLRLSLILRNLSDLFGSQAQDKGINLIFNVDPAVSDAYLGDPVRISQIINNMVSNALKFTNQGYVEIKIRPGAFFSESRLQSINFSVIDSGIGIATEKQKSIFNSFSQADPSTVRQYGGTGLGLSIANNLIEMMGGTLTLDSTPGFGTTFSWNLLLEIDPAIDDKTVPEINQPRNVLLVESQKRSRLAIEGYLRNWGIQTLQSESAADVRALLKVSTSRKNNFQIVILEWEILLNDLSLLDEIYAFAQKKSDAIPRVIITMNMAGRSVVESFMENHPHIEILNKPVLPSALFEAVYLELPDTSMKYMVENAGSDLQAAQAEFPLPNGLNILLAEDNDINQEVAVAMLAAFDTKVDIANNGKEACEKALENHYDLILMDVQMPVKDGLAAAKSIREAGIDTPIVAVSAAAYQSDKIAANKAGMNAHVSKPIQPRELFQVIHGFFPVTGEKPVIERRENRTQPEFPPQEKQIQVETIKALSALGNNQALYSKLIKKFCDEYEDWDLTFQRAIDAGDKQLASRMLHSLKGVADSLGAYPLARTAESFEQALINGQSRGTETTNLIVMLDGTLETLSIMLAKQDFSSTIHESQAGLVYKPETLLAELEDCLRDNQVVSSQQLERLKQTLTSNYDELDSTLVNQVISNCEDFEFDAALRDIQLLRRALDEMDS